MKNRDIAKEKNTSCLRLTFLGQKLMPIRQGGIEIVVGELSTRMTALRYDVTCYNRSGYILSGKEFDDAAANLKEYKNVKLKSVPTIETRGLVACLYLSSHLLQ